jgi:hypothetical protein
LVAQINAAALAMQYERILEDITFPLQLDLQHTYRYYRVDDVIWSTQLTQLRHRSAVFTDSAVISTASAQDRTDELMQLKLTAPAFSGPLARSPQMRLSDVVGIWSVQPALEGISQPAE